MKHQWLYRIILLLMILVGVGTLIFTIGIPDAVKDEFDFSLQLSQDSIILQYAEHTLPLNPSNALPEEISISDWQMQRAKDGTAIWLKSQDEAILICLAGEIPQASAKVIILSGEEEISEEALAVIQPEFAVLYGNAPDAELLKLLDKCCKAVYRVDLQGAVTLTVTGEEMEFSTQKNVSSRELFPHRAEDTGLTLREYDYQYVINVRSGTFHSPLCTNLEKMNEENKTYSSESKEELIAQGYHPCSNCLP